MPSTSVGCQRTPCVLERHSRRRAPATSVASCSLIRQLRRLRVRVADSIDHQGLSSHQWHAAVAPSDAVQPLPATADCLHHDPVHPLGSRGRGEGAVRASQGPAQKKIIVTLTDTPSRYDTTYGTGQPPPREAAPGLLAQLTLECLDTIGHVDQVVLIFMPDDDDIKAFLPQMSPLYHLFTTPNLAARLPPIRQLIINTPYCVHDRFGDVRLEFITAVTDNTRGPQRVIFSEGYTQELLSPHLLRQSPAYLSSAAVDEALASAGSPFVVVKSDDNTLTVGR
mmetsp:Transcript_19355/g.55507  ORF Transcript_19355/g.55507 Transcript_19355/m.55507 type:complete len:281 (-) Transcript_19355:480-1322(-)